MHLTSWRLNISFSCQVISDIMDAGHFHRYSFASNDSQTAVTSAIVTSILDSSSPSSQVWDSFLPDLLTLIFEKSTHSLPRKIYTSFILFRQFTNAILPTVVPTYLPLFQTSTFSNLITVVKADVLRVAAKRPTKLLGETRLFSLKKKKRKNSTTDG